MTEPFKPSKEKTDIRQLGINPDRVFYRTCSTLTIPVRNSSGELVGVMHLINKTQPGNFPPYHPETHPTAPERWRTSFNREDIAIIDRLNQTVSHLIDRVFY